MNDIITSIDDLLNKLNQFGKDGVPIKHSVDTKTVSEFGLWVAGGLVLAGLAAGAVLGLILKKD